MFTTELVEVKYSPQQNVVLEDSWKKFYKMDSSPKIIKTLILDKAEYVKFLKSRTKVRTQFEAQGDSIDLSFNGSAPFEFIGTKTEFIMPSGKSYTLLEELDAPCGLTKKVDVTQSLGQDIGINTYASYFEAEKYIFEKFKEDELEFNYPC